MLVLIAALGSSCAYYNTFYLAKKYYLTATGGMPYSIDKPTGAQVGNYQKSLDFSKKVVANYPRSKWADDAYLMWARALLGKDDPLQSVEMLRAFDGNFPTSPLQDEARFYLGVALRQARKYRDALVPLDEFLEKQPRHDLAPYAHLERARALQSLQRPAESAQAAGAIIEHFPKSPLVNAARGLRAEGLLAGGQPADARRDFQLLGVTARTDEERFGFLLREVDCLEAARQYDEALTVLNDAISHEVPPAKAVPGVATQTVVGAGSDRYGRLKLRIGTGQLLAGRSQQALTELRSVLTDYPKTPLAAEAQYRIAFAHETVLDDFEGARQEYGKVRDHSASSAFFTQATQRLQSLERLARFRGAGGDSLAKRTEAGFLLAEQYLFQLDKPERALEEYRTIARDNAGTDAAAKAKVAEAWVLRRRLDRGAEADSLLWSVVREHPATEAQLAARDFLEAAGQPVPSDLIKLPERALFASYDPELTAPPAGGTRLGLAPLGDDTTRAVPGAATLAPDSAFARTGPPRERDDLTRRGIMGDLDDPGRRSPFQNPVVAGTRPAATGADSARAVPPSGAQPPQASLDRARPQSPERSAPQPPGPPPAAGAPPAPAGGAAAPAVRDRAAPATGEGPDGPPPAPPPRRPSSPPPGERSPLDDPPRPAPEGRREGGGTRP